jgi:putative nucleotidyltransferase with HDIG domain
MSFICNLGTVLYIGPVAGAAMVVLSAPFIIVRSNTNHKVYYHIFNTDPIKTTFNTSNFLLSVYVSGILFQKSGGKVGILDLPGVLFPLIIATLAFFVTNCSILLLLFSLDQHTPFFPALLKNLISFLPNIAASAPLGYFIAKTMQMDGGEYQVLLFMLPLMLARYSFVLYLEAKQNYYNMIKTLTAALEAKDPYTEGHSHRVEQYAELIAKKMHRSAYDIENIKVASLLHDIGKIGIDETILNKPGRLTQQEREIIMTHPQISSNILKNVKLNSVVRTCVVHHHERFDGKGYPDGTKGDSLPMEAYIVGLADAYDAMTSDRPYCKSLTDRQVACILCEESGKQFHPKTVRAFLEVLEDLGKI